MHALVLSCLVLGMQRSLAGRFVAKTSGAGLRHVGREIGGNVEYMEQMANAGLIERAAMPAQSTNDPWDTAHMKGVAYIPSIALNQLMQWADFDPALSTRELAFASAATANTVRISLHWALHYVDSNKFLANLESFVSVAAAADLKVVLEVFTAIGADPGPDAPSILTTGAYKTSSWLSNPGFSQQDNATLLPFLDAYVGALLTAYGADPRVIGWDVYYQPVLCAPCTTFGFLQHFLNKVNSGVTAGWVSTSIIPGGASCDSKNVPSTGRTAVAFENYNGNRGAVGGDTQGVQSCASSLNPTGPALPVVLTGSMGRQEQTPSALCEIIFEAYGTAFLDIPAHPQIGYIIPFLMIGIDEFTANANQGLVWPNGTWYDAEEQLCFSAAVPPFPPPPPGPPPPGVNFTTADGLSVGLRNTTRTVQIMGLVDDTRWFGNFSFVPPLWGYIPQKPHRDFAGCHHVGDVTFRVQPASETNVSSWAFYSTAQGSDNVPALPLTNPNPSVIMDISNITDAATAGGQQDSRYPLGLHITRSFERAPNAAPGFAIRWNISVPLYAPAVRIGGLGFSLISDTFFGGTNNTAIAMSGSFMDAHIGLDHGFATFTRADGSRTLLIVPCAGDAGGANAGLEAWRPLLEDAVQPDEGMYEWVVHSQAWESEWSENKQAPQLTFPNDALHEKAWPNPRSPWPSWHLNETVRTPSPPRQWNAPTSIVVQPGQAVQYALCFSLPPVQADPEGNGGPRARDAGLAAAGKAVLTGVPGYVVTPDTGAGQGSGLYILLPGASGGGGVAISSVTTDDPAVLLVGSPEAVPGMHGAYFRVPVSAQPGAQGRGRVVVNFADGTVASVHYFALPPLLSLSSLYGSFAATTSYLPRSTLDSFGRSASFMPWDREDKVHVLQDGRPFVVGLSDDAGAGANLGMASKLAAAPHLGQVALLDQYVNSTLLGIKPDTAQPPLFSLQDPDTWRIFMTVWYYDKVPLNGTGYYEETDKCQIGPSWCAFNSPWCNPAWCALPPSAAGWAPATYRQYNFPHQIAVYHALYLTASNYPGIPTLQPASFYLNAAVQSIYAANCLGSDGRFGCLISVGLMDGTVFREVLRALLSEGPAWATHAATVMSIMRNRTLGDGEGLSGWNTADYPAGSEFAWDTTGQEEVAVWGAYFNASDAGWMHGSLNDRTVNSILGYMSSVPTWVYNGAAYGFCDFSNNAKWMVTGGCEREGGHYRSGLNSIPVIERYRAHPDDFYLLQVGIGGVMSPMPNIDAQGAPSMAFHTHPFILEHDPNSGDHGLGWFGSSLNAGGYLHNHSALGLLCFMCEITDTGSASGVVTFALRDTYHKKAFVSTLGLWMVAEAGLISTVSVNMGERTVSMVFESSDTASTLAGTGNTLPYNLLRLRFEQAAPQDRLYSFVFAQPSGAAFVRGAWAFAPVAGSPNATTTAVITF